MSNDNPPAAPGQRHITNKRLKRDKRQRNKDRRRRHRQEMEREKHRRPMKTKTTDELRTEIEQMERSALMRGSRLMPLSLAAACVSFFASFDRKRNL